MVAARLLFRFVETCRCPVSPIRILSNYNETRFVRNNNFQSFRSFSFKLCLSQSPSMAQYCTRFSTNVAFKGNLSFDSKQINHKSSNSQEDKSGKWTGKNAWKLGLILLGGWAVASGGLLIWTWGSPPLDSDGKEIKDEFTNLPFLFAMLKRAFKEVNVFTRKMKEPSRERLLPDPFQYPYYQPRYTLAIELTGVLVHPDWTYNTGWRFKKRPGIDYFLSQVAPPLFEVVIYSQEQGMMADPLITSLDSKGYIMYRLYRDATRYQDGVHIKDLNCLNRDLSRVIMVDWNPAATQLQPQNTLRLHKWTGDDDQTLVDLANFLKMIAMSEVEDVRTVLEFYGTFDDPLAAFRENQRKLQEEESHNAELAQKEGRLKKAFSPFFKKIQ